MKIQRNLLSALLIAALAACGAIPTSLPNGAPASSSTVKTAFVRPLPLSEAAIERDSPKGYLTYHGGSVTLHPHFYLIYMGWSRPRRRSVRRSGSARGVRKGGRRKRVARAPTAIRLEGRPYPEPPGSVPRDVARRRARHRADRRSLPRCQAFRR